MFCCMCRQESSVLGSKSIGDYKICKNCIKRIPSLIFEDNVYLSDIGLKRFADIVAENYKDFEATASFGRMHLDDYHQMIAIADSLDKNGKPKSGMNIFKISSLSKLNILCKNQKTEGQNVFVDVEFSFSTADPKVDFRCLIKKHCKCHLEKLNAAEYSIGPPLELQMFRSMVNSAIKRTFTDISKYLVGETLAKRKLMIARGVFMLPEDYSEDDLKKARKLLMKVYHPDVSTEDVTREAQIINSYYDLLKQHLKEDP